MPPLPGVRAVTYDLWLTLLEDRDPGQTARVRAEAVAGVIGGPVEAADRLLSAAQRELRSAHEQGQGRSVPELATLLLRECGHETAAVDAVVEAMDSATSAASVRLLPGARGVIERLGAAGLPLGLVCDTGLTSGARLRVVLDDLGLLDAFAVTVFSDECGTPKPSGRPFALVLEGTGVEAAQAVHVGDKRRRDVAGARAAGMTAVRYRGCRDDPDTDAPDADHVVDAHEDVLHLLGVD